MERKAERGAAREVVRDAARDAATTDPDFLGSDEPVAALLMRPVTAKQAVTASGEAMELRRVGLLVRLDEVVWACP